MGHNHHGIDDASPAVSRRALLKRAGFLGSVAVLGPSLLAACGDDTSSSSATSGGGALSTSPEAKRFRELLGWSDADAQKLAGQTLRVGAILPLSGPGSEYSTTQQNGVKLGIRHLEDYAGLKIEYAAKDHKSGDPQAGAAAARELGIDGFGIAINSYYGVFGSTVPALQKYKMLSMDPGGGTGNTVQGKDFFWGTRALTPDDGFSGSFQYVKEKLPQAKRVSLVIWDSGASYYDPITEVLKKALAENGQTLVGRELQKIGQTDYAGIFSKLKSQNPDIVYLVSYGTDPGYFMKQYVNSGLKAQVIGAEFVPAAAKVAGAAYDRFWLANDYFDFAAPPNPFSAFFMEGYKKEFKEEAKVFYSPSYYETTLAYGELARRVAVKGGDINKGDELQKELVANPVFKSVYGGDESATGEMKLDLKTHSTASRSIGLFSVKDGTPQQLASFDVGGRDFKATA